MNLFLYYCFLVISVCFLDVSYRFTKFGGPVPYRPAEDMAFSVARFIQKGGSFINYYMVKLKLLSSVLAIQVLIHLFIAQFHGGTNFGRTAGGPFIATSYDYDAPLDEYGKLLLNPKI